MTLESRWNTCIHSADMEGGQSHSKRLSVPFCPHPLQHMGGMLPWNFAIIVGVMYHLREIFRFSPLSEALSVAL